MSYTNFDNFYEDNPKKSQKKKNKGHKHRKHYDYNDDFQKSKQFKLKKKNMNEKNFFDEDYDA
jgi:hypothetical protein